MPKDTAPAVKKPRRDSQVSGLAGELFVAAELLKRGLQTSVTFGNAKGVDLFSRHPGTKDTFAVQVKALRESNYFLLSPGKVDRDQVYVFVLLGKPGQAVRYFVVPGQVLADDPARFGKGFADPKLPGILPKTLAAEGFEEAWAVFGPAVE